MKEERRWDVLISLLREVPHEIGAEVGVWKGFTTKKLLRQLEGIKKYYAIDPWKLLEEYKDSLVSTKMKNQTQNMEKVFKVFKRNINGFERKVKIIRKPSREASLEIKDESLDFVFIDGIHTYDYVSDDIRVWLPKVKYGGLISGHDYDRDDGVLTGVKKAVDEFFPKVELGANYVWWVWNDEEYILR